MSYNRIIPGDQVHVVLAINPENGLETYTLQGKVVSWPAPFQPDTSRPHDPRHTPRVIEVCNGQLVEIGAYLCAWKSKTE